MTIKDIQIIKNKVVKTKFELEELNKIILEYKDSEDFFGAVKSVLGCLIDIRTANYYLYEEGTERYNFYNVVDTYIEILKHIPEKEAKYYYAVKDFFNGNNEGSLKKIVEYFDSLNSDRIKNETINNFEFYFLQVFKNAFPGFWKKVIECLKRKGYDKFYIDLCQCISDVYKCDNRADAIFILENNIVKLKDSVILKEILGHIYYDEKMWGNSVAIFEQIDENGSLNKAAIYFMMAYSCGKIKERENEIFYYKKSYEEYPDAEFTLNNLGYAYYLNKQYDKAIEAFKKCFEKNLGIRYAANNYVRTLITTKQYKTAKEFIETTDYKIDKYLIKRLEKFQIKDYNFTYDLASDSSTIDENTTINSGQSETINNIKKYQFSSEKILEDELTLRIESGIEVFGHKLKIYRKKGVYGRQYILPNGKRLDLLCEDEKGDLHIIEIKKDSGYDDPYEQTADYLNWFTKNWTDHKNIYGIICLNNPTEDLLEKVRDDDRIKLFEYHISFSER